jgi:hypothetical protein
MNQMYIPDEMRINYDPSLLVRWKKRDPAIVPNEALRWSGPGVENGYGFGEFFVESFFAELEYSVIRNGFDLISKSSKYRDNNLLIADIFGEEKIHRFGELAREKLRRGVKIENIDLFVYSSKDHFFAEVKKGKDYLRQPQIRFMELAKEVLNCESKVIYLVEETPKSKDVKQ